MGGKKSVNDLRLLMIGPREVSKNPPKEPSLEEIVEILSKPSLADLIKITGNVRGKSPK
jgi:hypothetical protein